MHEPSEGQYTNPKFTQALQMLVAQLEEGEPIVAQESRELATQLAQPIGKATQEQPINEATQVWERPHQTKFAPVHAEHVAKLAGWVKKEKVAVAVKVAVVLLVEDAVPLAVAVPVALAVAVADTAPSSLAYRGLT